MLLDPAAPIDAESSAQLLVQCDSVDHMRQFASEAGRVCGVEGARRKVRVNQQTRFSGHNYLLDAAHSRRHYGCLACHRLEVDNAEGLVDGWAAKDGCVRVELDYIGARQHFLYPDHIATPGAYGADTLGH